MHLIKTNSNNLKYFIEHISITSSRNSQFKMLVTTKHLYLQCCDPLMALDHRFHILFLSRWMRLLYVRDTKFHASMYRSIHIAMHFCSELSSAVPGLLIHFLKHFSDIFVSSSCAFAMAICCFTWSISSSFCAPLSEPVDRLSIAVSCFLGFNKDDTIRRNL